MKTRNAVLGLLIATGVAVPNPLRAQQAGAAAAPAASQAGEGQKETPQSPAGAAQAQNGAAAAKPDDAQKPAAEGQSDDAKLKTVPGGKALGMSILGNQEAPTSLVIVPWKTSELGNALGVSTELDGSRQPVDKEVFMRMLSYYGIRSGTAPLDGASAVGRESGSAGKNVAQPATVDRRK
jgi:hypothetical protein